MLHSLLVLNLISQVMLASQVSNVIKEVVLKTLNAWLKLSLPLSDTRELLVALIPYSNYALLCEVSLSSRDMQEFFFLLC